MEHSLAGVPLNSLNILYDDLIKSECSVLVQEKNMILQWLPSLLFSARLQYSDVRLRIEKHYREYV